MAFIAYCLVIGFFDGGVNTPTALLVYECVGRERMAAGWSSFLFATGITISLGPPLAGKEVGTSMGCILGKLDTT